MDDKGLKEEKGISKINVVKIGDFEIQSSTASLKNVVKNRVNNTFFMFYLVFVII